MAKIRTDLKSFEELFKASEPPKQVEESKSEKRETTKVPLSTLKAFDQHPFRLYDSEKMQGLADSIRDHGVIVPILVRPIENERYNYEIVAGHNRVQASRIAGLDEIPCIIRGMDDDTAIILMIDSNLQQRENILPSEKAFAYKMKLEAIKRQGERRDLTSAQVGPKLNSKYAREVVADEAGESRNQVSRYIRLTELIPFLLEKVDERKLAFIPAVELSYLKKKEQEWLYDVINREENYGVPLKQASMLKGISQNGNLTYEKIDRIITEKEKQPSRIVKITFKKIKDYFSTDATPKEIEDIVVKALKIWFEQNKVLEDEQDTENEIEA